MIPHDILAAVNRHLARMEQPAATGASMQELFDLEGALGGPLPRELAQWLGLCRGGYLEGDWLVTLYTPREMLEARGHLQVYRKPARWLPIGDDGSGDYFCLVCPATPQEPAPVVFLDHETGETYVCGSSLLRFLGIALADDADSMVFDRDRLFAADPDAERFPQFGYGWE